MLQIYKKKGIRKNTNTIDLYFIYIMFYNEFNNEIVWSYSFKSLTLQYEKNSYFCFG